MGKKLPMNNIIESYFRDEEKCKEIACKIVKMQWGDDHIASEFTFGKTEKDSIHKIYYSVFYRPKKADWQSFRGAENLKIYELVFFDYDNLDTDDVLETINGFTEFLREHNFSGDKVKEKIDWFARLLQGNPNLPEDLELWLKLR